MIPLLDTPALAGREIGVSDWLSVTQERVDLFAEATGDHQWIHVDVNRAQREIGGTIAHGYLTLSLIPLMRRGIFEISGVQRALNYGSDKVRFLKAVSVGRRIRLRAKCREVVEKSRAILMTIEYTVEIEGEERPACVAETLTLFFAV
jgi:acyl dehydratase